LQFVNPKFNLCYLFLNQTQCNIAWACTVFGHFPVELMNTLYTGTFGTGSLQNANDISLIYGDDGLPQEVS
jgi:hypothetical protein